MPVKRIIATAVVVLGIFISCSMESVVTYKVTSQSDMERVFLQGITPAVNYPNHDKMFVDEECSLYYMLANLTSNTLVNITTNMTLFTTVQLIDFENISIIGHNKPTVECGNIGGLLLFTSCHNCTIEGVIWKNCGYVSSVTYPVLGLYESTTVTVQDCTFKNSAGQAIVLSEVSGVVKIVNCKFEYNYNGIYKGHGAAVYYNKGNESYLMFTISNCDFAHFDNGESVVYIGKSTNDMNKTFLLHNSIFSHNQGVTIFFLNQLLYISGTVIFEWNVAINGGAVFTNGYSDIIFDKNSKIIFNNNVAHIHGGAMHLRKHCFVIFKSNSTVHFIGNQAGRNGGAMFSNAETKIIFEGGSQVTFTNNKAVHKNGAGVFSCTLNMTFKGNCKVLFNNNVAKRNGGAITSKLHSIITFEGKSDVSFINNRAQLNGGAIYSFENSQIIFQDKSTVKFLHNMAIKGGALFSLTNCGILFKDNAVVIFTANQAKRSNDGLYSPNDILNKTATVKVSAGAVHLQYHCNITFEGKSLAIFRHNKGIHGGAVRICDNSYFTAKENASITFDHNDTKVGGAVSVSKYSNMLVMGKSVSFIGNTATKDGGALYFHDTCGITFKENTIVTFTLGRATRNGGVGYFTENCHVTFEESATVRFNNNKAFQEAGALYASKSNVVFRESSNIVFNSNRAAVSGGALYFTNRSDVSFSEISEVTFYNNEALHGGAMCSNNSNIKFKNSSTVFFNGNTATMNGGGIKALNDSKIVMMDDTTITFTNNTAEYGAAVFFDTTQSSMKFNGSEMCRISFINNNARIAGNSIYLDVNKSCNISCLTNRIVGVGINSISFIATPPSKLMLYNPAICIDNDMYSNSDCGIYYLQNMMFGQDIIVPACVLDYYNQKPVDTIQFLVHSESNEDIFTRGPNEVLISCDTFQGISIIGNESLSKSTNYTMTIALNVDHTSDWKAISVNLIIQLSPCHPGFQYDKESQICECYNASDVVFCSGSTSSIKRGYWFGSVDGKPTITFCPINYCNFSCCDTANGYYHLSPLRDNQCRSHRSGVACGSCTDGYTLSFDSTDLCTS